MTTEQQPTSRIRWQGQIESVQCRAWVWRYKMDNRTHHHLGFNLFVKGEADGREGRFIVAVSDTQHTKLQFRIGDVFKGTAWPCIKAKHDIADYYRAGGFKALSRADEQTDPAGPPFTGLLPPIEVFRAARGTHARCQALAEAVLCLYVGQQVGCRDRVQVRQSEALPERDLLLRPSVMPVLRHGPAQTGAVFRYLPVD